MLQTRILDVAIDQFGRLGFEGASTRDIAGAAETAMSSITYHFGGKEGLYLACADHIACQIGLRLDPVMAAIGDPALLEREQAIEAFLAIADGFALMMLHPDSANWARFIVREQQSPTEAFERLWCGGMQALLEGASAVLARIMPQPCPHELRALCMLTFGQAMVLRAGRASVCKALGTDHIGEEEGALLRRLLRRNTKAILTAEPNA
jgi:TetR/AcrR family transcriptional regulator, regulator of cefoperazone and chloramphenicol sensitivity